MKKITPLFKGLITGLAMLTVTILLSYTRQDPSAGSVYLVYGLYAAGIFWTLWDYSRTEKYSATFGSIFGQGFRCFIVVTLIMVIFTGIYSMTHPELAEASTQLYKAELVKKGNMLPAAVEKEANDYKTHFTTSFISTAIFGYLVIGVFFTAAGAGFLLLRRK